MIVHKAKDKDSKAYLDQIQKRKDVPSSKSLAVGTFNVISINWHEAKAVFKA